MSTTRIAMRTSRKIYFQRHELRNVTNKRKTSKKFLQSSVFFLMFVCLQPELPLHQIQLLLINTVNGNTHLSLHIVLVSQVPNLLLVRFLCHQQCLCL